MLPLLYFYIYVLLLMTISQRKEIKSAVVPFFTQRPQDDALKVPYRSILFLTSKIQRLKHRIYSTLLLLTT